MWKGISGTCVNIRKVLVLIPIAYCDINNPVLCAIHRHSVQRMSLPHHFYRATACNATHGIAVAILSFRPSVHLTNVCIVTKRNNRLSISQHHTKQGGISLVFPLQRGLLELSTSTRNIRRKRPTPFEKRRLRQISAYNVSTVRDSEKSSIITNRKSTTSFPTSYR